ncbi:hypothetical protein DERF_008670 [Dermatophagoides farinae]|uniref:Uncharacterized protein n=1 Tax=Dermatophagoides farinae TaxID=6954 RepID=A0A922L9F4_DERFA|nr:hypothetical protein DERF_008670 [Dermatophagoides farinae]
MFLVHVHDNDDDRISNGGGGGQTFTTKKKSEINELDRWTVVAGWLAVVDDDSIISFGYGYGYGFIFNNDHKIIYLSGDHVYKWHETICCLN